MALPTKEKTWQYSVNVSATGGTTLLIGQDAFFKIKNALKAFASTPWTVWGSCDGAGNFGNGDNVDRWAASTNLIWAASGSNHSWIVLSQTGLGPSAALCLDLNSASAYSASIVFFPTGVSSNGTATARPSATDELVLISAANWGASTSAIALKLHLMQSSDGECTRLLICRSGYTTGMWLLDKAKDPVSGWSPAACAYAYGTTNSGVDIATYALLNDAAAVLSRTTDVANAMYLTSFGWGSATVGENVTVVDDDTSEWPLTPIYLVGSTVGARGSKKGQLYDLWWGATTPASGSCYPADGTQQFAQFKHLVFPWDGSTPLLT